MEILGIILYVALLVGLFRFILWVTKIWLKVTLAVVEFALVFGAILLLL